jgi:hypothetical protein
MRHPTLCRGEALPRPPAPEARQTPMACLDHVQDPTGTGTIAPRRCSGPAGPAGQAPPDPYTRRLHRPTVVGRGSTADPPPTPVGARRCLARPRRMARQTPMACLDHVQDPTGTVTIAPRRCSGPAGPAGQAPPDPDQTSAVTSGHTRAAPGRALRPADPPTGADDTAGAWAFPTPRLIATTAGHSFRSTARSRPARPSCPSPCRPALPRAP